MKTLNNLTTSLVLLSLFFTSCKGQVNQEKSYQTVGQQQSFTSKNIKLTKTQGTTEHQNVHCSLQDKNGNLWFGTSGEGVYRYDGKEFTQFTEKDGLSNNKIWSILEDKSGMIWLGTDDGLCRFDGKTIEQVPFTIANPNSFGMAIPQSGINSVWSMLQDKSGIIWFGTTQDLYCYDGKSFSRFLNRKNISNDQHLRLKEIQCLLEDSNGVIWMGSGPIAQEGVIRFDGKSLTGSKPNGDGWIRYMVKDKNETIWFGGRANGNFTYNGNNFKIFTQKSGIGNPLLADKAGNIWFNGEEKRSSVENAGGIWRYDGKTFKNYTTSDGISTYYVWSMLEDRKGNIWMGTRNCGLYRYNGQTFEAFSE